ncbi:unnamed protein product [Dicrocoelium dendriticum]|nr:unnamed protein product [Dicrocoelium dendriticum]
MTTRFAYLFGRSRFLPGLHRFLSSSLLSLDQTAPRAKLIPYADQVSCMSSVLTKFVTYPTEEFHTLIEPFLKPDIIKDLLDVRSLQTGTNSAPLRLGANFVPRFLLYGQPGTGISVIFSQVVHFAATNDWLIVPFPNAETWLERCEDLTHSNELHQEQYKTADGESFDFPSRSANWLRGFLSLNKGFLEKFNPTIIRDVLWTKADVAKSGTPWTEIIQFAIARPKYSTDCIGILLREMRSMCSKPDGPPCLLVVDGVNFLWCRGTRMRDKLLHIRVHVDRLAIVHHLRRAMKGDWRHGAILTSLNIRGAWPTDREKYTPGYLLGEPGFTCMDPFIPVEIGNYTEAELNACLRFYAENNWLTNPAAHTPAGLAEIAFLADRNPLELDRIVAEW